MKKELLLIICILFMALAVNAQASILKNPSAASAPQDDILQLKENTYSFGKIPQGRPVIHVFEVVNTGKDPLMLENVQASCGCTTPEWSREAIAPGAVSSIKVGYNAYAEGRF